jgi:hypothetical protein
LTATNQLEIERNWLIGNRPIRPLILDRQTEGLPGVRRAHLGLSHPKNE